jgi:hypothetical protein
MGLLGVDFPRGFMSIRKYIHGAIGLPNSDVPDTFMNIELHRALISHFQKQRLALVLALDIDALHDVESG